MKNKGFTLVELSIVLVIIGLLVGGVLTGRELIQAAKRNSVISEFTQYKVAINTFKLQYGDAPGDMREATEYWGAESTTAGTCITQASDDKKTCNGNGNGKIDVSTGSNEHFRFWQHLSNAEIISGEFTGVSSSSSHSISPKGDLNAPSSAINETSAWNMWSWSPTASTRASTTNYKNGLFLGGEVQDTWNGAAIMTTADAKSIDTKLDDGHASNGKIWALGYTECTKGTTNTAHEDYDLANGDIACGLAFKDVF